MGFHELSWDIRANAIALTWTFVGMDIVMAFPGTDCHDMP